MTGFNRLSAPRLAKLSQRKDYMKLAREMPELAMSKAHHGGLLEGMSIKAALVYLSAQAVVDCFFRAATSLYLSF